MRTDAALAAGMQADTLFVFAKAPDSRAFFNQAASGADLRAEHATPALSLYERAFGP
jgi:hypothetical protein